MAPNGPVKSEVNWQAVQVRRPEADPDPVEARPMPAPAPQEQSRRPLFERLPRPLAPAPAPAATTVASPALLARLQDAVQVLAGKAPRRVDYHDRNQARKLLDTHADKLHLVKGAGSVVEVELEAGLED